MVQATSARPLVHKQQAKSSSKAGRERKHVASASSVPSLPLSCDMCACRFHSLAESEAHSHSLRHSLVSSAFERGEESGARQAYLFLQQVLARMPHNSAHDPSPPFTRGHTTAADVHAPAQQRSPRITALLHALSTPADSDALSELRRTTAAHQWHSFLHAVRSGMMQRRQDQLFARAASHFDALGFDDEQGDDSDVDALDAAALQAEADQAAWEEEGVEEEEGDDDVDDI